MSLAAGENLQVLDLPPLPERGPVFVDTSGRRHARAQLVLATAAIACGGYVAALGFGYVGSPVGPGVIPWVEAAMAAPVVPHAAGHGPTTSGRDESRVTGLGGAARDRGTAGSDAGATPAAPAGGGPTAVPGVIGAAGSVGSTQPGVQVAGTTAVSAAPGSATTSAGTVAGSSAGTTSGTTGQGSTGSGTAKADHQAAKAAKEAKAAAKAARKAKKAAAKAAKAARAAAAKEKKAAATSTNTAGSATGTAASGATSSTGTITGVA